MSRSNGNNTKKKCRPYYSTRTLLELSVGSTTPLISSRHHHRQPPHSLELLIYLRSADVEWWNSRVTSHQTQLLRIVAKEILPKEFPELKVERDLQKQQLLQQQQQKRRKKNSCPAVIVGEDNLQKQHQTKKNAQQPSRRGGRRGRPTNKRQIQKDKTEPTAAAAESCAKKPTSKAEQQAEYARTYFGEDIQIMYRTEEVNAKECATLLFPASEDKDSQDEHTGVNDAEKNDSSPSLRMIPTKKLTKRIIVWCYKFDTNNPTEPAPVESGGFPCPEVIPITSLFRSPCNHDDV